MIDWIKTLKQPQFLFQFLLLKESFCELQHMCLVLWVTIMIEFQRIYGM